VRLQIEKIHLIENRTRDLPACGIVPQTTMLPRAPLDVHKLSIFKKIRSVACAIFFPESTSLQNKAKSHPRGDMSFFKFTV
jgi:hypothetical protein